MATETRHAAWQNERTYAVRLLSGPGPAVDLADGLTDFLDAVDFAFEWLDRVDPARDRATQLAILETREGTTEEVWTYPPGPREAREDGDALVERFGFNPVTWKSGVRQFSAAEPKTRLRDRMPHAATGPQKARRRDEPPRRPASDSSTVPAGAGPSAARGKRTSADVSDARPAARPRPETVSAAPAVSAQPEDEPVLATARRRIEVAARGAWHDPVARSCLFLSAAALWLTLALADPRFLVLLLVSLPVLRWRRRSRAEAAASADAEDWL